MSSINNNEPRLIALKLCYKNELHRVRIDLSTFNYELLRNIFIKIYKLNERKNTLKIKYYDNEGDLINISNQNEYIEAINEYLNNIKNNNEKLSTKCLKFYLNDTLDIQNNITQPMLIILEKFIKQLENTLKNLKQVDYKNKFNNTINNTNNVINNAKEQVKLCTENVKTNVKDIQFEQILKDTTDGLKSAIDGIGIYAKEFVNEIKKIKQEQDKNQHQQNYEQNNNELIIQEQEQQQQQNITNDGEITESESEIEDNKNEQSSLGNVSEEWEQVQKQHQEQQHQEQQHQQQINNNEESKIIENNKYSKELSIIHEIFPTCSNEKIIAYLENANGNVDVVLNQLAESL